MSLTQASAQRRERKDSALEKYNKVGGDLVKIFNYGKY